MSSRILSPVHFNQVEHTLKQRLAGNAGHWPNALCKRLCNRPLRETTYETYEEAIDRWLDALKILQVLCVCGQYKHNFSNVWQEIADQLEILQKEKSDQDATMLSDVELFKALQSIEYQIECEHLPHVEGYEKGATPEQQKALDTLAWLSKVLAYEIIHSLPEWREAQWFIE